MSFGFSVSESLEGKLRRACNDLSRRLRNGESCRSEEFLALLPTLSGSSDAVLELLYTEYVVREELGQAVTAEQWYERFPEYTADLQQLFQVHCQVCQQDTVRSSTSLGRHRGDTPAVMEDIPRGLPPGRLVGGYQLFEELGRGGMGVVYRARQLTLQRDVAVKMILSGEFAGARELSRFQTEAQSAAGLHHPNIVQVYEVGADECVPFLSMELVAGGNLEGYIKASRPGLQEVAQLLEKIARAVHFAHEHGVIHRDLKPSNVLLTDQAEPKVADFGLAKQLRSGQLDATHSSALLGTPVYMAPEQLSGTEAVGPTTDIYALGVVLYEMLTGRPPFLADSPLEILRRLTTEEPPPPSLFCRSLPRDLQTICLKCLEKEPKRRYHTARELADDLRRYLRGEPIRARTVGAGEKFLKWVRRRPLAATFMALLMVSLTAVSGLWWTAEARGRLAREAASKAENLRLVAEREQRRSETSLYFRRIGQAHGEWQANMVGRATALLDECPPEMRHFEWAYLKSLCESDLLTLRGHTDSVWCIAVSGDGKLIASGSGQWGWAKEGEIILWDAVSGQRRATLAAHAGPVMSLGFSPDGRQLASSSVGWEGQPPPGVKIWNTDGELLLSLPAPLNESHALAYSPDGNRLAVGGTDGVHVWNLEHAKLERTMAGHKGIVLDVAFNRDGDRLASVGRDGSARLYDVTSGRELQTFTGYGDLRRVTFSPDGRYLTFTNFGGTVRIWDTSAAKEQIQEYTYQIAPISGLSYSQEGRRLGLSSIDGSVMIVSAETGREMKRLHTHDGAVRDLAFKEDGCHLVTAGTDGLVRLWDARTDWDDNRIDMSKLSNCGSFHRLAFCPDGNRLLLPNGFNHSWHGRGEMSLLVFNFQQRTVEHRLLGHTGWLTDACSTPDGSLYASSSMDGTVRIWNAATGAEVRQLIHPAGVTSVACNSAGALLATGCIDGIARIWDIATGELTQELTGHTGRINDIDFRPNANLLATAGQDGSARLWNTATGKQTLQLVQQSTPLTSLKFSHRGQLLAAAGENKLAAVFDANSGDVLHTLRGHSLPIVDIGFSPDDRRLASCSRDAVVKLWDVSTGEEALTLQSGETMTSLAFHPDGQRLLTVLSATIVVWDTVPRESPKLDSQFAAANRAWHLRSARPCRIKGLLSAADFHYQQLVDFPAITHGQLTVRARVRAQLGRWAQAAQDFQQAIQLDARDRTSQLEYALCQLRLGNSTMQQSITRQLLNSLPPDASSIDINNAIWFLVFAPLDPGEADQLVPRLLQAIAEANDQQRVGMDNTLGACLYRAGRYAEAREAIHKSRELSQGRYVEDWLLLSMIEARLGNHIESRQWLQRYYAWLSGFSEEEGLEPPYAAQWDARLVRTLLLEEAEQLTLLGADFVAADR